MRKSVLFVAPVLAVTAACEPTPPPPPPPPPTTVAMRYQECAQPNLNLLPNRCYVYAYGDSATMTVTATFGALTTSATYITAEVQLEIMRPDGTWQSVNWSDRTSGMSTTGVSKSTFSVGCQHGRYRWSLLATFANAPGYTFTKVSDTVTV